MTILENNAMQSIATSAGYMNSALVTSFAAYTMITKVIPPMYTGSGSLSSRSSACSSRSR